MLVGWATSRATPFLGHSIAPSSCAGSPFHYYLLISCPLFCVAILVVVVVVVVVVVPSGHTIMSPCMAVCHLVPWWSRPSYP